MPHLRHLQIQRDSRPTHKQAVWAFLWRPGSAQLSERDLEEISPEASPQKLHRSSSQYSVDRPEFLLRILPVPRRSCVTLSAGPSPVSPGERGVSNSTCVRTATLVPLRASYRERNTKFPAN